MKHRSRTNFEKCYICDAPVPAFLTTPMLELPDEILEPCCETCAHKEFPGWDEENDNGMDQR